MNELLTLAVLGAGFYALSKNSGLQAQTNELAPANRAPGPSNPDFAATISAATGIPPSVDNVTPGVLPSGQIRTLPPATPTEVQQLTNNPALQPVVIDGQWRNAPAETGISIQNRQQQARGQAHWRPEILPQMTMPMIQAASEGYSIENDILPAAAARAFERGGSSAFTGYRLQVGEWNHYRLKYDGGLPITGQRLNDVVDAEGYWEAVAAAPAQSWNLSGLGRLSRANMWET